MPDAKKGRATRDYCCTLGAVFGDYCGLEFRVHAARLKPELQTRGIITVSLRGQRCRFGLDADALWNYPAGMNASSDFPAWFALLIPVLILLALWDGVWKAIGMWKSARNKQLAWFICIAIFNTVGILSIP